MQMWVKSEITIKKGADDVEEVTTEVKLFTANLSDFTELVLVMLSVSSTGAGTQRKLDRVPVCVRLKFGMMPHLGVW